jgi:hypothetical protein
VQFHLVSTAAAVVACSWRRSYRWHWWHDCVHPLHLHFVFAVAVDLPCGLLTCPSRLLLHCPFRQELWRRHMGCVVKDDRLRLRDLPTVQ